jgi:hypothetical protein
MFKEDFGTFQRNAGDVPDEDPDPHRVVKTVAGGTSGSGKYYWSTNNAYYRPTYTYHYSFHEYQNNNPVLWTSPSPPRSYPPILTIYPFGQKEYRGSIDAYIEDGRYVGTVDFKKAMLDN